MHNFILIFLFYLLDISSGVSLSKYLNKNWELYCYILSIIWTLSRVVYNHQVLSCKSYWNWRVNITWHVLSLFSGTRFFLEYHNRLCFNTNTVTFTNYFFKLQFYCIFTTYQTSPNICLTIVLYYCFTVYLNKARSYVTKIKCWVWYFVFHCSVCM